MPRDTRQKVVPNECSCYIYLVGSYKTRKPFYKKNNIEGKIVKGKGLFGRSSKNKIFSVKSVDNHNSSDKRITICATCKQELDKGRRHRCGISSAYKNLLRQVSELPKKTEIRLLVKSSIRMLQIKANQACH